MSNLIFIDDIENPYIHPITNMMNNLNINYEEEIFEEDEEEIFEEDEEEIFEEDEEEIFEEDYEIDEFGNIIPKYEYSILSIDIGITHLGLSLSIVDSAFHLIRIEWVTMVDITEYKHEHDLCNKECNIDHNSKNFADWIQHFFLDYETLFERCSFILVEKQPPAGLVVIEQLILFRWRTKTYLIHPRSMHSFFGIGISSISGEDAYEERKRRTELIAQKHCEWHHRAIDSYSKFERKHDMADSICLLLFWLHQKNKEYTRKMNIEKTKNLINPKSSNMSTLEWMEKMKYVQY